MSAGSIILGTNSLKFTNTSSLWRVMSQAILEGLYNGATSWITATQIPTSYLQRGTALTPVSFNSGRALLLDCTTVDTCGIQFRSKDATTTNLTDSSIVSTGGSTSNYGGTLTLTASSINCKGSLFGWDSTAVAYMDICLLYTSPSPRDRQYCVYRWEHSYLWWNSHTDSKQY